MARGQALVRQWKMLVALSGRARGVRVADLIAQLQTSKSTLYRDLGILRAAGLPISTENQNGESRFTLHSPVRLPPLAPSAHQLDGLSLGRRAIEGLAGSGAARELDALLAPYGPRASPSPSVARQRSVAPNLVDRLDRALLGRRRCRIRYRGARDPAPRTRLLDPVGLHWVKGHLYLVAYDPESRKKGPKTFKLTRISDARALPDKAPEYPAYDPATLFRASLKVWTGEEHDVAIRLAPHVARLAPEYPLVDHQTLLDQPDGSVIIHARVAGLPEVTRWLLAWGPDAEALCPPELKAAVHTELKAALTHYEPRQKAKPPRATRTTTRTTRTPRPTRRPTPAGTGEG